MDLGNIRPQMEVVGSDDEHLGTVDHVNHNRIKLRRNDPASGGHIIGCRRRRSRR